MSGIYAELCKGWRQSIALRRHWCGQDIFDALCGEGAFRSDIFRNILYSQLFDIFAKKQFEKDEDAARDYEHIYDCDLLLIDDLGTEFANGFTISQMFVCLNERLLRGKSTMISTNLSLDDLNNMYSERVFSRITSAYTVLRITGDDIRIQKKLMGRK